MELGFAIDAHDIAIDEHSIYVGIIPMPPPPPPPPPRCVEATPLLDLENVPLVELSVLLRKFVTLCFLALPAADLFPSLPRFRAVWPPRPDDRAPLKPLELDARDFLPTLFDPTLLEEAGGSMGT